ncbi:hypothetical protein HALLA_08115 [Halostagnicola larsenii XH-48]|uniref:Uncharacterized protein n=1 Tax=Halostagnicola larsenii XH-48 TaxID=797299 RepID=W0JU90_9EURY|nr:hypothetical protein HALLA_08115 [Halostagnicola larsenii XH-48]
MPPNKLVSGKHGRNLVLASEANESQWRVRNGGGSEPANRPVVGTNRLRTAVASKASATVTGVGRLPRNE